LVVFPDGPVAKAIEETRYPRAFTFSRAWPEAGAYCRRMPVSARFIPWVVKERRRCSGWRGVLRCWDLICTIGTHQVKNQKYIFLRKRQAGSSNPGRDSAHL